MKIRFTFFILALISIALPALANDAYVVNDITVTLEGENPEELRSEALKAAKKEGLVKLLQHMTPESDWHKHPWILADETAADYIKSISIAEEKAADGAYQASFSAVFDPVKTRRMLLKHQLNFSEASNRNLLLVPLWLSDQDNVKQDAWLGALKAITENTSDRLTIKYPEEMNITPPKTQKHIEKWLVQTASTYPNWQIALTAAEVTTLDEKEQLTVTTTFADARQTPIAFSLPTKNKLFWSLSNASRQLHERLEEQLLTTEVIRADQEQVLFVRFKANRVQDIERMENALENISVVADVSPRLISVAESVFMVHMYSDILAFLNAVNRAGLHAEKQGNLYHVAFR